MRVIVRTPRVRREIVIGLGGVSATDLRWRTRNPVVKVKPNTGRRRSVMWDRSRVDVIATTTLRVGDMG